jgi:hypothetical protein
MFSGIGNQPVARKLMSFFQKKYVKISKFINPNFNKNRFRNESRFVADIRSFAKIEP